MPIEQVANDLLFLAAYTNSGVGATGLSVTADVYRGATKIVSAESATEVGDGLYAYTLPAASVVTGGLYVCILKTLGAVDVAHLYSIWCVATAGVEYLDAAVSSRAAAGASVVVSGPVSVGGDVTVRQGRDYSGAYALTWTLSPAPSPAPSAVQMTCRALSLTKSGAYDAGVVTVSLSAAETAALGRGVYAYEIEATISGLSVTLVDGTLTVERDV